MPNITIGGREFRQLAEPLTWRHEFWVAARVERGGLNADPQPGESEDAFLRRIVFSAADSDALFDLLGAALIPAQLEDSAWTPQVALETSAFLGGVTDPATRSVRNNLIAEVLFPFLRAAIARCATSPNSSATPASPSATAAPTTDGADGRP